MTKKTEDTVSFVIEIAWKLSLIFCFLNLGSEIRGLKVSQAETKAQIQQLSK